MPDNKTQVVDLTLGDSDDEPQPKRARTNANPGLREDSDCVVVAGPQAQNDTAGSAQQEVVDDDIVITAATGQVRPVHEP